MIRRLVIVLLALLAAAFFIRSLLFGHHWMAHHLSPVHNYKSLTLWSVFFMAVLGALALSVAQFTSPDEKP